MHRIFRIVLREPLFHFAVVALLVFVTHDWINSSDEPDRSDRSTIIVDEPALITFMQLSTGVFDPAQVSAGLDLLSRPEKIRLIEDYVREEALYRTGLRLGLDQDDYVIRRRVVQKVEYIAQGAGAARDVSDDQVLEYFTNHQSDYETEPSVTFTHVFFDSEARGREDARATALRMLQQLNDEQVRFSDAAGLGDRFAYFRNYIGKHRFLISQHFGQSALESLFSFDPSSTKWRGPIESTHGFHLILLIRSEPKRLPDFAEITDAVRADRKAFMQRKLMEDAVSEIVSSFQVRVDILLQEASGE